MDTPPTAREAEARARADQRLRRQRDIFRPLGFVVIAAVVVGAFNGHPAPAGHGDGLGVAAALVVFAASLALAVSGGFVGRSLAVQASVIAAMGAAGVALVALQPRGATALGGGAAVWMAVARLPLPLGIPVAGAITVGLVLAAALAGSSAAAVIAQTLLCVLLGLVAYFIKQARASQDTTELLLAQLEDAREEQLRSAAVMERGRIAGELHDVLAHSLSGAAIQLQGARKLAEREQASPQLRAAIDRGGELVRDGLANARQAVGALRGEELPSVAQLESLVATFRNDMNAEVTLTIEGTERRLPADASLALYRGAQEALTNAARYAPGAATTVVLRYDSGHTTLTVEDRTAGTKPDAAGLVGVGGGNGLTGMRERLEQAGGNHAGRPYRHGLARRAGRPGVIRIVIADDQRVVRDGLAMLIGLIDDIEVVGTASDGFEAVGLAHDTRPDVVLMDLRMPEMEGAEATRRIRSALPETQILVLTTYADDESLFPALQAGARGYLTKDASAEEIETAIRALAAGHTHLDPAIQQRLIAAVIDGAPDNQPPPDDLTTREIEVLKLIAAGLSNTEIATALVVSNATVKTHINHILAKTGARDRAQAVRYAYQHRIA